MNWNDYKEHVKACSEDDRRNMEEIEAAAGAWPQPTSTG